MAENTSDTGTDESLDSEEMTIEECILHLHDTISPYVQQNPTSTNTQLFCMLALLNAYVPESYLLLPDCQQILGPPDPIHGGPPFEERMKPFTILINTSNPSPGHISFIHQMFAQAAVEVLCSFNISMSDKVEELMVKLCGDEVQPYIIPFIKDLLTKREMGAIRQDKFSRMIEDILKREGFYPALSVLMTASNKFHLNPIFPQAVARLNYIARKPSDYRRAEQWANKAIERAPGSSYMADTLGQIHKNRLMKTSIVNTADRAFAAFEDVERKAENEAGPEMVGEGTVNTSNSFNNRGLFGFIQVAKIAYEKCNTQQREHLIQNTKRNRKVEDIFKFFSWYLTYSKPDMKTLEPSYFWKDVSRCYKYFTTETAAESTSFSGLLDCLNHGLFTSRGKRAGFQEDTKTVFELEEIQGALKASYEENVNDIRVAERYILSNIILSNRMPDSPQLTPVRELQAIIQRFLSAELQRRSPEFYLLVLLLFWPEEQPPVVQSKDDEEVGQLDTDDDNSEDTTWEDTEINEEPAANTEPEQLPPDLNLLDSNLQQYVTFMETAFERAGYAKYLRGRYLLPLFFLGKGTGLCKWIHKSTLDAIVEENVDAELVGAQGNIKLEKTIMINDMWINGEVWLLPKIRDILLPIRVEPYHPLIGPRLKEEPVLVCVGGQRIKAMLNNVGPDASVMSYYLGFNIQGLVVFKAGSEALVVP
ncbi:hypothetical protein JOB18_043053 [Solea senegalensis]|uniref:Sterile alpha motif domain-containing protein 9-like n=1 Tax=Solea senegalensis TaxID=28829 RepID=A0AAV6QZY5_SOLSE|nr:sterile alpha motif domain-containing protein 9-like [Solea senegalensis]KAG7497733.1 hypothetical protein JOB18_043053 [Solea senegalensis]KAG7497734.1 hypothetical protein JOB18_043053 [Solea senegalensis]KAG7497735.1 hypothetical protein JOB18_043053 [Solea senegalensis]